ncbi:sel1-repeat-containing protein ybeq [Anaeramoeba flamelloides]|uniref:Sel1-repeat-containing protein ybeq n=1 Tax=Anaeramoeba flamelloides TaxID=1746091 RepID=A0AAV7ZMG8_9EUKA|nr:sel1-repeat-containing protein ybeq [Anaeramoeba flamelloides]
MLFEELKRKSRDKPKAQAKLGFFYFEGIEVKQDLKKAVRLFMLSTKNGHSMGYFWLGECYYLGKGVNQSYNKAFFYFKQACKEKNGRALGRLGDCYFYGYGVEKNILRSLNYYLLSSECAVSNSDNRLSTCFKTTNHTSTNKNKNDPNRNLVNKKKHQQKQKPTKLSIQYRKTIFELKKRANSKNDAQAQLLLGIFYKNGNGVGKDLNLAFEYFKKSSKQGNPIAQRKLALRYLKDKNRKNIEKSFHWNKLSADNNNSGALNNLGIRYLNGIGMKTNLEKGIENFKRSIKLKNSNAYNSLGICYLNGDGVPRDNQIAYKLFFKSHYLGSSNGTVSLGSIFERLLDGFVIDNTKAFNYYWKASENNNDEGQYSLAFCYLQGIGTIVDERKAFELFKKSAKNGNISSKNSSAVCYEKGRGCKKNLKKAFKLYKEAAQKDEPNAIYNLGICYLKEKGCKKNVGKAYDFFRKSLQYDHFEEITIIKNLNKLMFLLKHNAPLEEIKSVFFQDDQIYFQKKKSHFTVLHMVCNKKHCNQMQRIEYIKLLIDIGYNYLIPDRNNRMAFDYLAKENEKQKWFYYTSIIDDFINLFQREELTDMVINNKPIHRIWVEHRLGMKINNTVVQVLESFPRPQMLSFLKWVYSGVVEKNYNYIFAVAKVLNISSETFISKSGRLGIIKDLKSLMDNNTSYDFFYIVNKKEIKSHKFLLQARSDLFRSMFLIMKNFSNRVKDYSKKNYHTLSLLFNFLYTDQLDLEFIKKTNINKKIINELEDVTEYYQLNRNSNLIFYLHKLI